jgi:carbamoyltransferase
MVSETSPAPPWRRGEGGNIDISSRVYFPHSLGVFYSAITQFIGFPHYGDEYKVMGLAPYGQPTYLPQMREIVHVQSDGTFKLNLKYFRHHTANVSYSWNDCAPEFGVLHTDALAELLGPKRQKGDPLEQKHKDIARSAQAMYEEAFFALLNALYRRHPLRTCASPAACAIELRANGKSTSDTRSSHVSSLPQPATAGRHRPAAVVQADWR